MTFKLEGVTTYFVGQHELFLLDCERSFEAKVKEADHFSQLFDMLRDLLLPLQCLLLAFLVVTGGRASLLAFALLSLAQKHSNLLVLTIVSSTIVRKVTLFECFWIKRQTHCENSSLSLIDLL